MFARKLSHEEVAIIHKIEAFVQDKHNKLQGHDYSHVLAVAHYAIQIARGIPDPVDPFILICGALFHDIGRIGTNSGQLHGIREATIAEEYLRAVGISQDGALSCLMRMSS